MDEKKIILKMLVTLTDELNNVQQKGAGYFTCSPFVERYNKLLTRIKQIVIEHKDLLATFQTLDDSKSVDPSDKTKLMQKISVEISQLVSFLKTILEEK